MFKVILAILSFVFCPQAWAARTLYVAPIEIQSVHGGTVGGVSCATANMVLPLGNGVIAASHQYNFHFRNGGPIRQTLQIIAEKGTEVRSRINNPSSTAPDGPTQTAALTNNLSTTVTIEPESSASVSFFIGCSARGCTLKMENGGTAGIANLPEFAPGATCSSGQALICITAYSKVNFKVIVQEDRGAVSGSIASYGHRVCGGMDTFPQTPPFVQLNGGRPF